MPSGISTLLRQIHPRERPEMRTWTQSALKSSSSNSSCALARNWALAEMLGVETTGVPDFFTATRFFGCPVFFKTSSRLPASVSKALWVFKSVPGAEGRGGGDSPAFSEDVNARLLSATSEELAETSGLVIGAGAGVSGGFAGVVERGGGAGAEAIATWALLWPPSVESFATCSCNKSNRSASNRPFEFSN